MANNFFIIGSGFTKAIYADAPINSELLDKLINAKNNSIFKKLYDKYQTNDIEILLTKYDMDNKSNSNPDRDNINEEIAEYFKDFRFKKDILDERLWTKDISNIFRENDVIVDLNYDCFLEGLLDYQGRWTPNRGYSYDKDPYAKNPHGGYLHVSNPLMFENIEINPEGIRILKIHGSENFRISSVVGSPGQKAIGFEMNSALFPKSCAHSDFGGGVNSGHYVIAPSYVKKQQTQIYWLMIEAYKAINIAENLIIIGCGLRPEDSFLWFLIMNYFMPSKDFPAPYKSKRIYIIDPMKCGELKSNLTSHLGNSVIREDNLIPMPHPLEDVITRKVFPWKN